METSELLDEFNRHILDELQRDARLPVADLGRRIGLSPSATAERLRRMEEAGVVRGYRAEIDREALGLEVLAFIRMTCDGPRYAPFQTFVKGLEEVRECHHLTGGDAFLLKVTSPSIESLEKLIEKLLPFGVPTTSLVLSSPVERRSYQVLAPQRPPARKREPRLSRIHHGDTEARRKINQG